MAKKVFGGIFRAFAASLRGREVSWLPRNVAGGEAVVAGMW
jgi:hypothetical protein